MKKYVPQIDNQLFEMANIPPKRSGINFGIIQIRPEARHSLFPHIHFVKNIKNQNDEYTKFSIDSKVENIKIVEQVDMSLTKKEIDLIKKFIVKNNALLKQYYLQAEYIVDTVEFLSNLKKI
jgi:hypothetical protein